MSFLVMQHIGEKNKSTQRHRIDGGTPDCNIAMRYAIYARSAAFRQTRRLRGDASRFLQNMQTRRLLIAHSPLRGAVYSRFHGT